ncbi:MAG: hypothetical protein ACYCWN_12125 [Ferrimicrobium sp.]|jgi:hypothetical protein|uniref:Uncharacterized protein n=1 Tax=Ferrimicrobium acidiphilum TaxID=121039 RepID=A0ABV3Y2T5_9ACTN|nr:hypothetical protein [Ferrimicrobium sp.]MCL5972780.1 hypothetical protein [Actinomycetota bacterium]
MGGKEVDGEQSYSQISAGVGFPIVPDIAVGGVRGDIERLIVIEQWASDDHPLRVDIIPSRGATLAEGPEWL